ncbi:MAG TPA: hypothetical protein VLR26_13920 [Frankiaceae bacterium]|nr:hypothetical protein [Frankiaceae bacterium]
MTCTGRTMEKSLYGVPALWKCRVSVAPGMPVPMIVYVVPRLISWFCAPTIVGTVWIRIGRVC